MKTEAQKITCKDCGAEQVLMFGAKNIKLIMKRLCFECDFWHDLIALKDDPHSVRFDGHQYFVGAPDERRMKSSNGFDGADFQIFFFDGRKLDTTNLWFNGAIPARFKEHLPNNAILFETKCEHKEQKNGACLRCKKEL